MSKISRPLAWTLAQVRLHFFLGLGVSVVFLLWYGLPNHPITLCLLGTCAIFLGWLAPGWSLALLALVAPFEQSRILAGFTLYTTEWLLILVLPGWIWNILAKPGWRRPLAPLWIWSAPFIVLVGAAALAHSDGMAFKGLLRWMEFFGVLLLGVHILRRGRDAERVLWAMLMAAVLSAGIGFWEFLNHAPQHAMIAWHGQVITRAAAGFGANTLAVFLAMLFPWAMAAALFARSGWRRWLGCLSAGGLLAGLLACFSLTGVTALVAGLLTGLLILIPSPKKYLWLAAVVALGSACMIGLYPTLLQGSFWQTKLASAQDRWAYAGVVARLLHVHPWLGWGPGHYRFVAPGFGSPEINSLGLITYPHALWLTVLAETGILGLGGLVWFIIQMWRWASRRIATLHTLWPRATAVSLIAGAAGFMVANLTEHCLIHDRGVLAAIFFVALVVLCQRPSRPYPAERARLFNHVWQQPENDPVGVLAERRQGRQPLYALLETALQGKTHTRILELGCGPAWDALALAGRPGAEVHAVDRSPAALRQAQHTSQQMARTIHLHQTDLRHTGLATEGFDLIFSQGVLEHFPEPELVWHEMVRLLKPGGSLVIDVPQTWNPYTLIKFGHQLLGDWPWGWETQYSRGELKAWGRQFGLRYCQARGYGYRGGWFDPTDWLRKIVRGWWPKIWRTWEEKTGALWMMQVVVRFEKPGVQP